MKQKINKEALEASKKVKCKAINEKQIVNKNESKDTGVSNQKR